MPPRKHTEAARKAEHKAERLLSYLAVMRKAKVALRSQNAQQMQRILAKLKRFPDTRLDAFRQLLAAALVRSEQKERLREWHKAKAAEEQAKRQAEAAAARAQSHALEHIVRQSVQASRSRLRVGDCCVRLSGCGRSPGVRWWFWCLSS